MSTPPESRSPDLTSASVTLPLEALETLRERALDLDRRLVASEARRVAAERQAVSPDPTAAA